MAVPPKKEDANYQFMLGMQMRYENVVWKEGDQHADRTRPGFPGHTPIYPDQDTFLRVYKELCKDLNQPDMTHVPPGQEDLAPSTPTELFFHMEDTGVTRNQAMIMAAMLGMDKKDATHLVADSYEGYKELHPKRYMQWGLRQTLKYEDARRLWEEKMAHITPTFREVLGQRTLDVPEVPISEAELAHEAVAMNDTKPAAAVEPIPIKDGESPSASAIAPAARKEPAEEAAGPKQKKKKEPRPPKAPKPPKAARTPVDDDDGEDTALENAGHTDIEDRPSALPPVVPEDVLAQSQHMRWPHHGNFGEKVEAVLEESIGEGRNFPDQGSFLRTLLAMARSQENVDIDVGHLLNPAGGLSPNEARIVETALNIRPKDHSRFREEARHAFRQGPHSGEVRPPSGRMQNSVDSELLRTARAYIVADAINDERNHVPLRFEEPRKPRPVDTPSAPVPLPEPAPVAQTAPLVVTPEPAHAPAQPDIIPAAAASAIIAVAAAPQPPAPEPKPETIAPEPPPRPRIPLDVIEAPTPPAPTPPPVAEEQTVTAPTPPAPAPTPAPEVVAAQPEKKKKEKPPKPPEPPPAPSLSADEVKALQKADIEEARGKFEELKAYDADKVAYISTELFKKLADHSTLGKGYLAKSLHEAAGGKISIPTFQSLVGGKTKLNPESFAVGGAVDVLVPNLVLDATLRDEATHYLTCIPIKDMKEPEGAEKQHPPAHYIVGYAQTHGGTIGDVLRMARHHYRKDRADFSSDVLHIKEDGFTRLSMGKCKRNFGETDVVTQASDGLGLTEDKDKLVFRKLALQIPLDVTQKTLDEIFIQDTPPPAPAGEEPPNPKRYVIDNTGTGRERAVALSRFYEAVRMLHGKRDFDELAEAIAGTGEGAGAVKAELARMMNNSGGRGGFDTEAEADIKEKPSKTMRPAIAEILAAYAYPGTERDTLRGEAVEFLSSEKKHHADRSAMMHKAWETRRSGKTGHATDEVRPSQTGFRNDDDTPNSVG